MWYNSKQCRSDKLLALYKGDIIVEKLKNKDVFETMPVPKAVFNMAVPTIVGQLIVLFYNMADTFFVGQTNNPVMVAGASLILPVFNIALALSTLAGIGGGVLVSRLLGKGELQEARRVASFSVNLGVLLAGSFSLGTFLFMDQLMGLLGATGEPLRFARDYALCVIVLGGVPTVLSNTFANVIRSTGESKKAAFGITMGGLLNVALDPLFMFVLMPEGNEIMGAGIATCLSNVVVCGYFILTIHRLGSDSVMRRCPLRELPSRENMKNVFAVGMPSSVATLLFDIDYMVIGRLMTSFGAVQMAAIGIVLKVERLPLNIGVGICQGMDPIVAYNFSSGNRKRMKATISFSRNFGLICGAASILLYELFAPQIMSIFIRESQTVLLGTQFLRVRILATPLMFMSFFTVHLFNCFGKGGIALFLGVMRWAMLNIPMLFLLNALFGMYGIVWSQVTADSLTVAISVALTVWYMKKLER